MNKSIETKLVVKYHGAEEPCYQTSSAAGCDLVSTVRIVIPSGAWSVVPTGLFVEIPQGYEGQVRSRSGLAAKHGLFVLNGVGTIDSDYRGEIKVILANFSGLMKTIDKGDRVAQLVFSPIIQASFEPSEGLSTTIRGTGGFGSTGV